jgi:RloB-like protein
MAARRENTTRRRSAYRQPRTRLLVVCGGEATEPAYLDGLTRSLGNSAVTVKVVGTRSAPADVVTEAALRRDSAPEDFDEVWCVLDVDEFKLDEAERIARQRGVRLAVSNPCFELWLLLHHEHRRVGVVDAADAIRLLRRYVPRYDKRRPAFAHFEGGVEDAIRRGRDLDDGTDTGPNPSSGVWRLVEKVVRETDPGDRDVP